MCSSSEKMVLMNSLIGTRGYERHEPTQGRYNVQINKPRYNAPQNLGLRLLGKKAL